MYLKFKRCNQQSVEYNTLKNNLHVFNCILKKTIPEAKIQYYDKLFTQYKGDIKKTWQTISVIICKSNIKRKTLDKIIVDSKVIKDKREICNKFNDFFAIIGPKLASLALIKLTIPSLKDGYSRILLSYKLAKTMF